MKFNVVVIPTEFKSFYLEDSYNASVGSGVAKLRNVVFFFFK